MYRALTVLAALLASLLTAPIATADASDGATVATSAEKRPHQLSRLHATRGAKPGIFDQRGARVLLRGINVNGLGEYFQANPAYAPTVPLRRADFREIARLGFNTVRLIVSWSALEPTPGAYDTAYVARIRKAVDQAADYGVYVVLDMHQDAWGIAVDTHADEVCPPHTQPGNGWDGAPAWATITDGLSTCHNGTRELAPAVKAAWQHFYDDTDGLQGHLAEVWRQLARDFATTSNVAGYDLLNEPGIGTGADATTALGEFYGDTIRAIRRGERQGHGFSHIVFFEPSVYWSAIGGWTTPSPNFTDDTNLVFAPHIYAEALSPNTIEAGFDAAARTAEGYGVTVWGGEWGFFSQDPETDADKVERYGKAEDAHFFGGAWWDWKQACGDPHVIHQPGGEPDSMSPSLIRYTCPGQVAADGPAPTYGEVLSRPVPRAVPGVVTRLVSDGRSGTMVLAGRRSPKAEGCSLRVFVPAAWADQRVRTQGVTHLTRRTRLGNVILRGCVHDTFRLRIG